MIDNLGKHEGLSSAFVVAISEIDIEIKNLNKRIEYNKTQENDIAQKISRVYKEAQIYFRPVVIGSNRDGF